MNDMLKSIIDMDKKACEMVKEAEQYRLKTVAGLNEKKSEIMQEESRKAIESAKRKSQKQRAEGKKILNSIHEHNEKILKKMNDSFELNRENWIETAFKNIIKN